MRFIVCGLGIDRRLAACLVGWAIGFIPGAVAAQSPSAEEAARRYYDISGRAEYIASEVERARKETSRAAAGRGASGILPEFMENLPDAMRVDWALAQQRNYQASLEAGAKYDWMQDATYQAGKALERAKNAPNEADRAYWVREANSKLDQADRLSRMFVTPAEVPAPKGGDSAGANQPGAGGDPTGAAPGGSANPGAAKEPAVDRFNAGLLKLKSFEFGETQRRAAEANPILINQRAQESFGEGRAGAGGVSLHAAAECADLPPKSEIRRAAVRDGRLVLEFNDGGVMRFPALDMDHLAVAVRSIYDAPVEGTLTADESNLVAFQTGKERFGEVVWNKQLLPEPTPKVAVGEKGRWELGPAIGLLSDVVPSTNRVTYYGAIRGTRMGRTLLEADGLLAVFVLGVDWRTGKPARLPMIEGLTTGPERAARRMFKDAEARARGETPPQTPSIRPDPKRWWLGSTWYVWVPDRFVLRRTNDELEFSEARMKLFIWSADESHISADDRVWTAAATEHYDELAQSFPALKDLVEVTKVTSIVRRLRRDGIELDRASLGEYKPTPAETPVTIHRYNYLIAYDVQGRVLVEPPKQEVRP